MKLDYSVAYAKSLDMDGAIMVLREMVCEMLKNGYILQGGMSLTLTSSNMYCVTQTLIKEREEHDWA